jgi:hypothetical protein
MSCGARPPVFARAGATIFASNSIVHGSNYRLVGTGNDVLGNDVFIVGDANMLLGVACTAIGIGNVDVRRRNSCVERKITVPIKAAQIAQRQTGKRDFAALCNRPTSTLEASRSTTTKSGGGAQESGFTA